MNVVFPVKELYPGSTTPRTSEKVRTKSGEGVGEYRRPSWCDSTPRGFTRV